jgi:exosortase
VSLLVQTEPETAPAAPAPIRAAPSWQIAILSILCLWLYGRTIVHLVGQWWHDPNFSHGFFVPVFSAFVIWQERDRLRRIALKPSSAGLLILAGALGVLLVGQLGAELFLARVSLLVLGAGLIVLFLGWNFLSALSFPLAFLLLMIPIPTIIFNQITFPLQLLASKVAAATLPLFSVPILREGNVIILPSMALEVAEACSGIRSLMSLVTLAIIYGYLMEKRVAGRWLLALGAIPISVAANSVRIIGTGLLVQYWDPDKAQGFFHTFSGWLIFVVSLVMLYLLHGLMQILWRKNENKTGGQS